MEARDSSASSPSPSPAAAAIRDGPSPAEDDPVLSVASALAKDAALHFQAAKFAECADVLAQLLLKKPDDPKVTILSRLGSLRFGFDCVIAFSLDAEVTDVKDLCESFGCE